MTEATDTVEIDGTTAEVADDPDDARMIAVGMTVSGSEKASTGDYENYEPHESVRVTFDPAIDLSDVAGRRALRTKANTLHRDIQDDLNTAISNRISEPGFEDWGDARDRNRDTDH